MTKNDTKTLPLFRDQNGNLAIWQKPNLLLTTWFGLMIASLIITNDQLKNFLVHLSMAFLFTWAYLEITQGINYFRRVLGLFVMIICIMRFIQLVN